MDSGTGCGPHGGDTGKTKSWTIEPVHGGGRVKWFGGKPDRARGVWWFAHKTIGGRCNIPDFPGMLLFAKM
jgi:hypothetical protein